MSGTDIEVLRLWIEAGEADAFAELVSRYTTMVYATCLRVLGNAHDAEDVAQQCFVELARRPKVVRSSLAGWLHRLATHRAINYVRGEQRRRAREAIFVADSVADVDAEWEGISPVIDEAIAALDPPFRDVIVQRFLLGYTHDTVATNLGIAPRTVRYRQKKGIEVIRKHLKDNGIVSGSGFASMLFANLTETIVNVPITLTASMGKMALAGTAAGQQATTVTLIGGLTLMSKKAVITILVLVALLFGSYFVLPLTGKVGEKKPEPPIQEKVEIQTALVAESPNIKTPDPIPTLPKAMPVAEVEIDEPLEEPPANASISGRVTDSFGEPVMGGSVRVDVFKDKLRQCIQASFRGETDIDGKYLVDNIDAFGKTYVTLVSSEFTIDFMGRLHNIDVTPGTVLEGINFEVHEVADIVAGLVVTPRGEPVAGAQVSVDHCGYTLENVASGWVSNTGRLYWDVSDANGEFLIAVSRDGLCDISVFKQGSAMALYTAIPSGTDDVVLKLRNPGRIVGYVTSTNDKSLSGILVRCVGMAGYAGEPVDKLKGGRLTSSEMSTTTGSDGHYEFDGLSEDYVYVVSASWPEIRQPSPDKLVNFMQSFRLNRAKESPSLRRNIEVRTGGETRVDLQLAALAKLYGTVRSAQTGKLLNRVVVKCTPEGEMSAEVNILAEDGTFAISLVPPAPQKYEITVEYRHVGGTNIAEMPMPVAIEVSPGDEREVNLIVEEPVTARGQFLDTQGHPCTDVQVAIRDNNSGMRGMGEVDDEGRFTLNNLPPEKPFKVLAVKGEAFGPIVGISEQYVGEAGEEFNDIIVVCIDLGGIEGVFVDKDGKPVVVSRFDVWGIDSEGYRSEESKDSGTDDEGAFYIEDALPIGEYKRIEFEIKGEGEDKVVGVDRIISISKGMVTNIGAVLVQSDSED